MGKKNIPTSHRHRHGQAIAIQHAAAVLMTMANEPRRLMSLGLESIMTGESTEAAALGCLIAARFLCPLTVELALKALIAMTNDDAAPATHDLICLLELLPQDIQNTISQEFDRVKKENNDLEDKRTLEQIFRDHRSDFVDWRYLDSIEELAGIRLETFHYAICAILALIDREA